MWKAIAPTCLVAITLFTASFTLTSSAAACPPKAKVVDSNQECIYVFKFKNLSANSVAWVLRELTEDRSSRFLSYPASKSKILVVKCHPSELPRIRYIISQLELALADEQTPDKQGQKKKSKKNKKGATKKSSNKKDVKKREASSGRSKSKRRSPNSSNKSV